MKKIKTLLTIKTNYYGYAIALLAFSLLFPVSIFNISLIILFIAFILMMFENGVGNFKSITSSFVFITFILLYAFDILSVLNSNHILNSLSVLEKNLFLIFCPLLFSFADENIFKKHYVEFTYVLSCVIMLIIGYSIAFLNCIDNYDQVSILEKINFHFTYQEFSKNIGRHAIYLTANLILAFFMVLESGNNKIIKFKKPLIILFLISIIALKSAMLVMVFFLLLYFYIVSKRELNNTLISVLISISSLIILYVLALKIRIELPLIYYVLSFLIVLLLNFMFKYLVRKVKVDSLVITSSILILTFMFGLFIYLINDNEINKIANEYPSNVMYRYWNWSAALSIIKGNFWFGIGVGDIESSLVRYYKEFNFESGVWFRYNEHNQYLRYMLKGGVLALIIFLIFIYKILREAINSKDIPFLVLVITFILFSITESTLERHYGIVFFGFFFTYFIQKNKYAKK